MSIIVKELTKTIPATLIRYTRPKHCPITQIAAIGTYHCPEGPDEVWMVICPHPCALPKCRLKKFLVV